MIVSPAAFGNKMATLSLEQALKEQQGLMLVTDKISVCEALDRHVVIRAALLRNGTLNQTPTTLYKTPPFDDLIVIYGHLG